MGKTSTTKASKKKTVSKKKESAKKVKADPAAPDQKPELKNEEAQVSIESNDPQDSKKPIVVETPAPKKPVLLSDLIFLKFDAWQPDDLFVPIQDKPIVPEAPPFVSGKDDQEINQKRKLLFNTFDIKAIIAEGERFSAEKAAAEKAEAERIAAEKAAAEKAEAERIAAEKAAAEKAEAERIAAEKAAAEKAEAERIAAEKAAAEKAEAERIAAEKAAAALERKKAAALQQASEPKVEISYDQPVPPVKEADPMNKTIMIFAGGLALLLLLLIGTSLCNSQKFYIKKAKSGIEIWQGRFSPKGEKQLITLAGVKAPETVQKIYSKYDVYPIIFNYFLNKADALLDAPGIPDFEGMKYYINLAKPYAVTQELSDAAALRLNGMTQTLQNYKAGIAASKAPAANSK